MFRIIKPDYGVPLTIRFAAPFPAARAASERSVVPNRPERRRRVPSFDRAVERSAELMTESSNPRILEDTGR